ncbi:MAG: type II toxin-antitoxin system RelE/ParE family toxin [Fermentimonas sp.]|jgi:plasmid stabilization system protein ParE
MRYKVKWTLSAENDFDLITDYLLENWSASVLQKFIEITEASIQQISRFPTLFPIIYKKERVRKCVLTKQNTLYYKIKDSEIQILRIFDTRQNPSKLQF